MAKAKKKPAAQQLDLAQLLPGFEIDRSDPSRGIQIRPKKNENESGDEGTRFDARAIRFASTLAPPSAPPSSSQAVPEVRYEGIKIVNGKVIREGRHSDSQWQYVGLAGAMPRRVWDYHPDVVLERRADEDGIVRLLPVGDTPGESLLDLEYAVVDVETTGAGFGRGHRITEIAIVHVNGRGQVVDEFTTLINPQRSIPMMITSLTHIDNWMVRDAPVFSEVAAAIRDRLEGRVFVAHNAGFDWGFISMELLRALGAPLRGRMLCTVRMARKLVPELSRRSLDSLTCFFGVENDARHRAFGDARVTADVFGRLLRRAEDREIAGWNELQKLLYARGLKRKRRSMPTFFDPLA